MAPGSDERWERMWELFHEALALPPHERAELLERRSAGDAALRREVEQLIAAHAGEESFLAHPASLPPDTAEDDADSTDPRIGDHVGAYRIVDVIGEGGMGIVFLAEQQEPLRRRVALKLVKLGMDTREIVARFETERQALALMSHPSIARVFDAGIGPGGRPYFVMEHVAGVPITQFCDEHRLTARERIELFLPVCLAIQHAHQKGIVHRDLKPSNVLVGFDADRPLPKVIDFGVAKAIHGLHGGPVPHTEVGRLIGTPEYMSPEQAEMSPLDVDTRTDVYSLGAVLYELLTGTLPWDRGALSATDPAEIRRFLREQQPPRPSSRVGRLGEGARSIAERRRTEPRGLRALLAGDLDWILMKALEKDRTRRYAAASELAADLERHLRQEPVLACPPGAAYRLGKFVRRNRALVAGAAAVAATLVIGVVGTAGQALRATRAEQRARARAAEAEAVNAFLLDMLGQADPAINPSGREVTLRQVLDQAARRAPGAFPGQPGVEAEVERAIGSTYRSLGQLEAAETHVRAALRLHETDPARDPERAGEARLALADVLLTRGEYVAAQEACDQAGATFGAIDPAHPALVRVLRLRADARQFAGDLAGAAPLYEQALALVRRIHSEPHADVAGVLAGQALLLKRLGRPAEALGLHEEAIRIYREIERGDDPNLAAGLANLATVYEDLGRIEDAERTVGEVLAIQRRLFGDEHHSVATTLNNLGNLELRRGDPARAESHLREALAMSRRLLGERHPQVSTVTDNLASALAAAGRHAEAEELYRAALALRREHEGEDHPGVTLSLNNLAALLRSKGDLDGAAAMFREVIPRFRRQYGADHPNVVIAVHNLGKTLMDAGRLEEAEPLLREAASRAETALPPANPARHFVRGSYGRCLLLLGRPDEARALLVPAHDAVAASLGPEHPRVKELAAALVDLDARRR